MRVVPEECACPECTGTPFDPQDFVNGLLEGATDLLKVSDPLEAELYGTTVLLAGELLGEDFAQFLAEEMAPTLTQSGTPESLALLLTLDALGGSPATTDAVRHLLDAGVPAPAWAPELSEALRAGQCRVFTDEQDTASALYCTFDRAGRTHGFVIDVDHTDCHAAEHIDLFPGELCDEVLESIQDNARRARVKITERVLEPAEFRWQVERALDARAVHDQEDGGPVLAEELDDDGPGYHLLAVLLKARLRALPEPSRPPAPHGDEDENPAR